jgi:hypothetical protein
VPLKISNLTTGKDLWNQVVQCLHFEMGFSGEDGQSSPRYLHVPVLTLFLPGNHTTAAPVPPGQGPRRYTQPLLQCLTLNADLFSREIKQRHARHVTRNFFFCSVFQLLSSSKESMNIIL